MAKKKTYKRRARARRYFYKRKKGVYTPSGLKARFCSIIRIKVLNNINGVGEGFHWFNYGSDTTINHINYNVWSNYLRGDADFAALANQYTMFKIYGVSFTAIPSPMQNNAINNRKDCTAVVKCQPVRSQVNYNQRFLILDPLASSKMYWKVGSYTQWCYSNPSAEQQTTDNDNQVTLTLTGNSGVEPYERCPVWTIRVCIYVKFKARQSD